MNVTVITIPNRNEMKVTNFLSLVHVTKLILPSLGDVKLDYVCNEPCMYLERSINIYEFESLYLSVFKRTSPFIFLDDRWQLLLNPFFQYLCFIKNNKYIEEEYINSYIDKTSIKKIYKNFKI